MGCPLFQCIEVHGDTIRTVTSDGYIVGVRQADSTVDAISEV